MRRILLATAALALSAGSAFAADTATVAIDAFQAQTCDITASSSNISLAALNVAVSGVFQYQCNFVGNPTLNFVSGFGGVKTTENGGGIATYGIYLNDNLPGGPPNTWLQSNATPQSYPAITLSAPANTTISPTFQVGLTQALPVAGTYSDTLTISITP